MDGDILTVLIVVGASVIIMCIFPLMTLADRNDDITQLMAYEYTHI